MFVLFANSGIVPTRPIPRSNQGRLREALAIARRIRFRGMSADSLSSMGNAIQIAQTLLEMSRAADAANLYDSIAGQPPFPVALRGKVGRHRAWYLRHTASALAAAADTTRLAAMADSIEANRGVVGPLVLRKREDDVHLHPAEREVRDEPLERGVEVGIGCSPDAATAKGAAR